MFGVIPRLAWTAAAESTKVNISVTFVTSINEFDGSCYVRIGQFANFESS